MVRVDSRHRFITSHGIIKVEQYTGDTHVALPLTTAVELPDGTIQASQLYSLNSGCVLGITTKLAESLGGRLEPIPFEYNPDDGYFKYLPGSWLASEVLEAKGWKPIRNILEMILDPKVKSDNVRAVLNQLRPDLNVKVSKGGPRPKITKDGQQITMYELMQYLVLDELTLL